MGCVCVCMAVCVFCVGVVLSVLIFLVQKSRVPLGVSLVFLSLVW